MGFTVAMQRSWTLAATAGLVAGGIGLGINELLAGVVAGAPSFVTAIGAFVIDLQPPGAKQFVVDLVGTADKLALNVLVALVALLLAAALGIAARRDWRIGAAGLAAAAVVAAVISLRDPLVDPLLAAVSAALAGGAGSLVLRRLLDAPPAGTAEMPAWGRRRFLGSAVAFAGVALAGGAVGRYLLERRPAPTGAAVPSALPTVATTAAPLPAGAIEVAGISPLVVPTADFYRIDTKLLVPRLDAASWTLTIQGQVERELTLTYQELLARPQVERYVTIACVSNEVGGDLVGNAKWTGVPLVELLDEVRALPGATQVVGRAYDGWTAGFPTAWLSGPGAGALVAVGMNDAPLNADHGFPARLIVPGLFGYVSATKWLTNIELTTLEAFDGYWIPLGWAKDGPILLQSRIDVPTGGSVVAGPVAVAGVAWAPTRGISAVEVQVDGGAWEPAGLGPAISEETWVQWIYRWQAEPGDHELRVRATDRDGAVQEERTTPPAPDGARGYHRVQVRVG
jgi:DMSO/TMAO reductase YedYZ molybdopterin-dependent catalytic subunit